MAWCQIGADPIHWRIYAALGGDELKDKIRIASLVLGQSFSCPGTNEVAWITWIKLVNTFPYQKTKCYHFDEIFITGCTGSCQNDNFQCSQWWKFRQNDALFRFNALHNKTNISANHRHNASPCQQLMRLVNLSPGTCCRPIYNVLIPVTSNPITTFGTRSQHANPVHKLPGARRYGALSGAQQRPATLATRPALTTPALYRGAGRGSPPRD